MNHPSYEILTNYFENHLSAIECEKVKKHLSQPCERCNAKINRLRSVLVVTAADHTVAPSPTVLNRAVALLQKRTASLPKPHLRILAALQFDSHLQFSPATFRGIARARQLLFSAQQVDIDLQLTPDQSGQNLRGQIIAPQPGEDKARAFVSLQSKGGDLLSGTETDQQGQFAFHQIEPGVYDLVFDIQNQEIAILDLVINND